MLPAPELLRAESCLAKVSTPANSDAGNIAIGEHGPPEGLGIAMLAFVAIRLTLDCWFDNITPEELKPYMKRLPRHAPECSFALQIAWYPGRRNLLDRTLARIPKTWNQR